MASAATAGGPAVIFNACVRVVPHGFLGESVQGFPSNITETLRPVGHELNHFALDFRVSVVEIWVESEQSKLL